MNLESLEEDLAALSEGISAVLEEKCDRRAIHEFFDGANDLDESLWAEAAELGFLGIGLPEEHGGLGLGAPGLDVLYRALGRALAPGAFVPTLAAAQWLSEKGDADLCGQVLPEVIAGKRCFAVPLAPGAEALDLDGGKISGQTPLMLTSRSARTAVIAVKSNGSPALALIEIAEDFAPLDGWDKTRLVGRYSLSQAEPLALIDDADGSAGAALGRWLALGIAGDCIGGAYAAAEQTVEYLKERSQFGRTLASMQALKHRVADLYTATIQSEAVLEQAVTAIAVGEASADMWADLAKASAGDCYKFVAEDCVQLHGGVGFTWEFDCHIFLKRALLNREIAGTAGSLRDAAADYFAQATSAGTTTAELTL